MIETILIARDRKTGKDVLLAGRDVPFRKQLEAYKELCGPHSDTYETVVLAQVQPHKKPLKFITKAEHAARIKAHEKLVADADKEAAKTAKPTKSPKPPKGGPDKESAADDKEAAKTETKTGTETDQKSDAT